MERAAAEGVLRDDMPPGFARHMLDELVHIVANRYLDMDPPQGADLVVDALLNGIGTAKS